MIFLFCLAMSFVALRLVSIQVVQHGWLTEAAEHRRENTIALPARRGTIYDRNGNVLAVSRECRTLYCNPEEINEPYLTAEVLVEHLGGTSADYVDDLTSEGTFTYLERKIDTKVADAIIDDLNAKTLPGVYELRDTRREYPYGAVGGQILGVVGVDGNGLTGLELYYDSILSGTDGEMVIETGLGGTPISDAEAEVVEAVDGTDIIISIDINVQRVAEERIVEGVEQYKADSGSVMVTDPKTGEILAACSTPLLDLTNLNDAGEGATNLKLVSDSFEPGSIFKVLTAAIGIDAGLVSTTTEFYVPWALQVGDDTVTDDDDRYVDMNMNLREILRRSSNTGAALVAQEYLGAEVFSNGVSAFGIGQITGIDYPGEVRGIVKQRSEYDGSSVGSMSFGQGLAVPLVQMVRAIGAIANEGVPITPHFLVSKGTEKVEWARGEAIVSPATCNQVIDMMRTVIEEGTGMPAQVQGYDVAGKTGTGEQADTDKGGYIENKYTSSLIGFAQASDPTVLVYVGLNGTPYLATASAAPLFSSIMGEALTDMNILPTS